jgi:hypothetical protein
MNIKRLAIITVGIAILMMLFMFVSCSSTQMDAYNQSLGSVKESPEISRLFKTYQYHPEYKYYYAGSKNDPDAVVGIHNDYLLEETSGRSFMAVRWTEFKTTQKKLELMINAIETHGRSYGAVILDHDGTQIGIIYAFEWWEFQPVVRKLEDNLISVVPKVYAGNNRGAP